MNHHQLSKLDLGYISLFLDNDEVVNGLGESKRISEVIANFARDVKEYCEFVNSEFPPGYKLYIPDFWHIAFGRAKCLTKEDGQLLWDVSSYLVDVMGPLQASKVVRRVHSAQFSSEGIEVDAEFGGSLFVWI